MSEGRTPGGACGSSVRGIWANGYSPSSPNKTDTIDYITISTLGNAADFGDSNAVKSASTCASNSIRGLIGGGSDPSGDTDAIDYITIATLGNAIDFGNLTVARQHAGSASSPTRAVFGGGYSSPSFKTDMDYVQIMSTGNAVDFGDLTEARNQPEGCSNGHGGL